MVPGGCKAPQFIVSVKALVWFWWIDETLSANLVYQSVHEIGSTFQVAKQMKIMTSWHDDGNAMVLIKYLDLEKEKKNKKLKAKLKLIGAFLV